MPADHSELSSIADLLEQVTRRITQMAETMQEEKQDVVAKELFSVERSLIGAHRRVIRLLGSRK